MSIQKLLCEFFSFFFIVLVEKWLKRTLYGENYWDMANLFLHTCKMRSELLMFIVVLGQLLCQATAFWSIAALISLSKLQMNSTPKNSIRTQSQSLFHSTCTKSWRNHKMITCLFRFITIRKKILSA